MKYGIKFLNFKFELQKAVELALLIVVVNHLKHFQREFFELLAPLEFLSLLFRQA